MQSRLLALIGASAVLFGSTIPDVWHNKDVTAWTQKDAQQIVTSSPWAKEKPMPIGQRPGVAYVGPVGSASSPPTADLGNPANERNGPPPTTPTPSLSSAPVGAPPSQPVLKVIWASALPVRLAVLKLWSGNIEPTTEQFASVERDLSNYVIAVGLPAPEAGSDAKTLASAAFLSTRGKPSAMAIDSEYRRIHNSDVYFFRFVKTALPLTITDREVEFMLTVGQRNLHQKFHLAAMRYQGRLAL